MSSVSLAEPGHWARHLVPWRKGVSNDNIFGRERTRYKCDGRAVKNRESSLRKAKGFHPIESFVDSKLIEGPTNVRANGLHLCRDADRIKR